MFGRMQLAHLPNDAHGVSALGQPVRAAMRALRPLRTSALGFEIWRRWGLEGTFAFRKRVPVLRVTRTARAAANNNFKDTSGFYGQLELEESGANEPANYFSSDGCPDIPRAMLASTRDRIDRHNAGSRRTSTALAERKRRHSYAMRAASSGAVRDPE